MVINFVIHVVFQCLERFQHHSHDILLAWTLVVAKVVYNHIREIDPRNLFSFVKTAVDVFILHMISYARTNKYTSLILVYERSRTFLHRYVKPSPSRGKAFPKCFISLSSICSGESRTFINIHQYLLQHVLSPWCECIPTRPTL